MAVVTTRRALGASMLISLVAAPLPPLAGVAFAQASGMFGIGETTAVSIRATVKALDPQGHTITLAGPNREITLEIGPRVKGLGTIKPGDTVIARYEGAIVYVVAPQGTKLPPNSTEVTGATIRSGNGRAQGKMAFTGRVIGIDPVSHTLDLVDPAGGRVHTVDVVSEAGKRSMRFVKIGDTITVIMAGELLVSIEPNPQ